MLFLVGLILLVSACLVMLALVPSAVVVRSAFIRSAQEAVTPNSRSEDSRALVEAQALIGQMNVLLGTSTPVSLIADILAKRPPKTTVNHITYTPGTLVFSGAAEHRDNVNVFRTTVAADARFVGVTVPINALVGVEDGAFTMTVTGSF